jgi:Fe-S-cluster-containing dehydrogenase component
MHISRRSLLKGIVATGAAGAVAGRVEAREAKRVGPDEVGMLYDATRCIGCRACVTRCKEANDLPVDRASLEGGVYDAPTDLNATTKNIIKLYAEGDRRSFVKMQCMHCADPACVSVCMAGALHREGEGKRDMGGERKGSGVVIYDKLLCVGCRYCQIACPFNVPKFMWHAAIPLIVKCEMCRHRPEGPACCEVCPREAVIYGRMSTLAREAHRRIEAAPGRYQKRVYGEVEGGGTHVLYLAAAAIPFEKLGLPELPHEPLPEMSEHVQHTIYKGFIAPAALYAAVLGVQLYHRKKKASQQGEEGEP